VKQDEELRRRATEAQQRSRQAKTDDERATRLSSLKAGLASLANIRRLMGGTVRKSCKLAE
jgi:hypothetical protein